MSGWRRSSRVVRTACHLHAPGAGRQDPAAAVCGCVGNRKFGEQRWWLRRNAQAPARVDTYRDALRAVLALTELREARAVRSSSAWTAEPAGPALRSGARSAHGNDDRPLFGSRIDLVWATLLEALLGPSQAMIGAEASGDSEAGSCDSGWRVS